MTGNQMRLVELALVQATTIYVRTKPSTEWHVLRLDVKKNFQLPGQGLSKNQPNTNLSKEKNKQK